MTKLNKLLFIYGLLFIFQCTSAPKHQLGEGLNFLNKKIVVITNLEKQSTYEGVAYIINNNDMELNLQWKLLSIDCPSEWEFRFCDNVGCHLELPQKVKLKPIPSHTFENEMKLYVMPYGIAGKGKIKILIYDKYSKTDTLEYNIRIE